MVSSPWSMASKVTFLTLPGVLHHYALSVTAPLRTLKHPSLPPAIISSHRSMVMMPSRSSSLLQHPRQKGAGTPSIAGSAALNIIARVQRRISTAKGAGAHSTACSVVALDAEAR